MTDIVELLLLKKTLETVEDVHVLFADAAAEIERLRDALAVIYRAHEKVLDEGDAWFITNDTTVGYHICSVLGAPPEEKD